MNTQDYAGPQEMMMAAQASYICFRFYLALDVFRKENNRSLYWILYHHMVFEEIA